MTALVGRAHELTELVAAFEGLAARRSSWVEITGEPGIGSSPAHAELYLELAVSSLYRLDLAEATTFATMATKSSGDADALIAGTAAALLAFVSASTEEPAGYAAARAACNDAAAILDGLDDDTLARRLDAPYHLGWAERLLERDDAAAAYLERAVEVADSGGGSQWLVPTIVEQAKALLACGHVARAREASEEVVAEVRASGIGLVLLLALTAHVAVLSACGETTAALVAGAEALDVGRGMEAYHVANARRQLALARLDGGDPAGFLEETGGMQDEDGVTDGGRAQLLEGRVRAALACGRPEIAAAAAHFEEAGAGLEALRTVVMGSELVLACGRSEEALAECRRALDALGRQGAKGCAQEARLALRRMRRAARGPSGGHGPGSGQQGTRVLSRREREVALLVAEGRTNREIASRLFLSNKTVESHLANIMVKLGAPNRVGVARAVGLEEPGRTTGTG